MLLVLAMTSSGVQCLGLYYEIRDIEKELPETLFSKVGGKAKYWSKLHTSAPTAGGGGGNIISVFKRVYSIYNDVKALRERWYAMAKIRANVNTFANKLTELEKSITGCQVCVTFH